MTEAGLTPNHRRSLGAAGLTARPQPQPGRHDPADGGRCQHKVVQRRLNPEAHDEDDYQDKTAAADQGLADLAGAVRTRTGRTLSANALAPPPPHRPRCVDEDPLAAPGPTQSRRAGPQRATGPAVPVGRHGPRLKP